MRYRVAIDIGGGFTDLVAIDEESGKLLWSKTHTTQEDLSEGVKQVFAKSEVDSSKVIHLLHGQTLVINTIVQRKGAKVGLITTKGFRDILELQRANRRDIYNLRYRKPEALVPRYLRLEVSERVKSDGEVLEPVSHQEVEEAYRKLASEQVESIAITFISSYANPQNEQEARRVIQAASTDHVHLTISSEVTKEWREYERTSTAVLNAYVKPLVHDYVSKLETDLRGMGLTGTLYMMLAGGGVATFDFAKQVPIHTIESGPVAGVVGAAALAEVVGERNIIVLDGGSTTTKASLVEDLRIRYTTDYAVERDQYRPGYPIKVPVVDIVEIGNGGSSIAWLDELGNLKVGPLSAGAFPGPACYGFGGKDPTVTDAYLAVGFLNPEYFLGGAFNLKPDLSRNPINRLATNFDISTEEAAFAIVRLANDNASHILRLISVQRGRDPRDFTLVAHGGSGPMMAPFIARELEIGKIIVPGIPSGNFSAWGLLMSDLRHDLVQTRVLRLDTQEVHEVIDATFRSLEEEMLELFRRENVSLEVITLIRDCDMRYYGQEHTIKVGVMNGRLSGNDINELAAQFHTVHQKEFGFRLDSPVEVVNLHVAGIARVRKPALTEREPQGRTLSKARKMEREVYWGKMDFQRTPVYEKDLLPIGEVISGPAVIEEPTSTIIVSDEFDFSADKFGNVVIVAR